MTDADLIELIQERPPEELSEAEIQAVRDRLPHSEELREAVKTQIEFEGYLNATFAEVRFSAETLLHRVGVQKRPAKASPKPWAMWALAIAAAGTIWLGISLAEIGTRSVAEGTPEAVEIFQPRTPLVAMRPTSTNPDDNGNPKPPPTKPKKKLPWDAVIDPAAPIRTYAETTFEDPFRTRKYSLSSKDLRKWLLRAPGGGFSFSERTFGNSRVFAKFSGIAKLAAPWPENAVLRLSIFDPEKFQIHFWSKGRGLTLRPVQSVQWMWGAYVATKRDRVRARPADPVFVTSDSARHDRMMRGMFELRWHDGRIVMTRGGVVLLSAPLPSLPEEVYFDGTASFGHIEMFKSDPADREPLASRKVIFETDAPAKQSWKLQLRDDHRPALLHHAEGATELSAVAMQETCSAGLTVPNDGFCEVVVKLRDVSRGTGVFLGDAQGKPLHRVAFLTERRKKIPVPRVLSPGASDHVVDANPENSHVAHIGQTVWLKITPGFGVLRFAISDDGKSWGRTTDYDTRYDVGPFQTVGVFVMPTNDDSTDWRSITLEHVRVQQMPDLVNWVPRKLLKKADDKSVTAARSMPAWQAAVAKSCPPDVKWEDWRIACALATLRRGNSRLLQQCLIEEAVDTAGSPDEAFARLEQLGTMGNFFDNADSEVLHKALLRVRGTTVLETIQTTVRMPFWTHHRITPRMPDREARGLLQLAADNEWEELQRLSRQLYFLNMETHPDRRWWFREQQQGSVFDWAESLACARLEEANDRQLVPWKSKPKWMHPLLVEMSKEAFTLFSEFDAAVRSGAFGDACRMIGTLAKEESGLLPDGSAGNEGLLFRSLRDAVALAMRTHPKMAELMRKREGPAALLRVRQAMKENDRPTLENATVRYPGTDAAAEAHRWLGDRAVVTGHFAEAVEHYQQALASASPSKKSAIESRMQLASSLQGQAAKTSTSLPVTVGDRRYEPQAFNGLTHDIREERKGSAIGIDDSISVRGEHGMLPAGRYSFQNRGTFAGKIGINEGRKLRLLESSMHRFRVTPWKSPAGERLIATNRFQVACFDQNGKQVWFTKLGNDIGNANDWVHQDTVPLVNGKRIFVRRLSDSGMELACLQTRDGKVAWNRMPNGDHVCSDPVIANGLLAVLVTESIRGGREVSLVILNPNTGDTLARRSLMHFRDDYSGRAPYSLAAKGNRVVGFAGGTLFCCDAAGRVRWLRKDTVVPWQTLEGPSGVDSRPIFAKIDSESVALFLQPGSRTLSCVDVESGHIVWRRAVPQSMGLCGVFGTHIVVRHKDALSVIELETGRVRWKKETPGLINFASANAKQVCYLRTFREPGDSKRPFPYLVWADLETGRRLASCELPVPRSTKTAKKQLFSRAFTAGGKWWFFAADTKEPGKRQLIELKREGEITPLPRSLPTWESAVTPTAHGAATMTIPGWKLLTPQSSKGRRAYKLVLDKQDGKRCLCTFAEIGQPVHLAKSIRVPAAGGRLEIEAASGNDAWEMSITVAGKELFKTQCERGWKTRTASLDAYSGKTITVVVSQKTLHSKRPSIAFWHRLRVVPKPDRGGDCVTDSPSPAIPYGVSP